MTEFNADVLQWALRYIELGWAIFRTYSVTVDGQCTCGDLDCEQVGKHPFKGTRGFKDATTDHSTIKKWFGSDAPLANIAIATGEISSLTVLDVDIGQGKCGAETWAELIRMKGEPQTLKARTGSGGRHVFFAYCPDLKTGNNRLGRHVDVKNDGGYIVAPPSRHRCGRMYDWEIWDIPLAQLPDHLMPPLPHNAEPKRGRPRHDDPLRRKYGLSDVKGMLECIPADNRDMWRNVGIILGRTFQCSNEAWALYTQWADTWGGTKSTGHDRIMHEAFYTISQQTVEKELTLGTIVKAALAHGWTPTTGRVPVAALYFHVGHGYVYRPTLDTWDEKNTNLAVSPLLVDGVMMKATQWLQRERMVTCVSSHPTLLEYTPDMNLVKGELVPDTGAAILNVYRHATVKPGEARLAEPWVAHCRLLFNKEGDAEQFFNYLAHRVQKPGEKPRFALLIGGEQGTGKDSAIEMCVPAIGPWNIENIAPSAFNSAFNAYLACTLLRVNEAADAQYQSRWILNEEMKNVIAGTPDHAIINGKYQLTQHVRLYCGVIVTTNHLLSSIHIPEDDRRYDVIECATKTEMGIENDAVRANYFHKLWEWWYADANAAAGHVAAWLRERDLTGFSPNTGQRKTAAHKAVVHSGMASDEWCADALGQCSNKNLVSGSFIFRIALIAGEDPKTVKPRLPHAMKRLGYIVYDNPGANDGRHTINGKSHRIFVKPGYKVEPGWEATLNGYPKFEPL